MIFLDSNVVIDLLRGSKPILRERYNAARREDVPLALSTVALFELRFGAMASERVSQNVRALDAFLEEGVEIVAFDAAAASEAGDIRAGLRREGALIGPYDILIAAQARARGAALVTGNVAEFRRVPRLRVMDWGA
ncbi:MAG: PIN domain-containing protein [Methylobacteriaceae bacterium]|nr:PIN domain-containing protein [Methylobacteriaceae bacterium]